MIMLSTLEEGFTINISTCSSLSPPPLHVCRETDPNWITEIGEDIRDECIKFGPIVSIQVMGNAEGEVYLKYEDVTSAQLAVAALHGRWFGGRQISCRFIPNTLYHALFGRL